MSKRSREHITLDLTALVDVIFQLLIFFLVSTVYRTEELSLMLKLPTAESGKQQGNQNDKKITSIEITNDVMALNGKKITDAELGMALSQLPKDKLVTVRADQTTYYKRIVTVLDLIQKYQLENVSLITEKK